MHRVSQVVIALVLLLAIVQSPASAAIVGLWKFDGSDPVGVAVDSAGGDHNGTFNGGAQAAIIVDGIRGDVLRLNPGGPATNGGYISVPSITATGSTTWAAWVNLAHANTDQGNGYPMFMTSTGNYEFRFSSTTQRPEVSYTGSIVAPAALQLNTWHQIVHTGTGNNVRLYVDGVLVASGANNNWLGGALNFGRRMSGIHYFNGMLDDVQIWNEALSDGKVAALYNPVFDYDGTQLASLFSAFDVTGSTTVAGREWSYVTGLTGHQQGQNWTENGVTFLQLDEFGNGLLSIAPVPEPSTVVLLAAGGLAIAFPGRRQSSPR